ncbi:MAG TPA: SPFH domain-containing protein [Thermomicrobiales bacterium]|nr:SPFH domain-containing protein [Thermomicrobiales bacterium]
MAILDVIEFPNEGANELVRRVPEVGSGDFALGSQLIVRESQRAIFVRDGKALDVFEPGRHTLSTNNIPLLARIIGIPFGESPFKAEVYFVSMREFTDMKWGSAQPLVYRDTELGMIRLRAFGTYSLRIADPQLFVAQMVGTRGSFNTSQVDEFLRSIILNEFNDLLGDTHTSILDLQGMTKELADAARLSLASSFTRYGLELTSFQISAVTPPDEVMARIDERSGMAALGNLDDYTRFRTAQAIGDAANNPGTAGDLTGAGVGMAAGVGIGQAMAGALRDASAPQAPATATTACPNCKAQIPVGSKFCPECGTNLTGVTCKECGAQNSPGAKFCNTCGKPLTT